MKRPIILEGQEFDWKQGEEYAKHVVVKAFYVAVWPKLRASFAPHLKYREIFAPKD